MDLFSLVTRSYEGDVVHEQLKDNAVLLVQNDDCLFHAS